MAQDRWAAAEQWCGQGLKITGQVASAASAVPGLEVCVGLAAAELGQTSRAVELLGRQQETLRRQGATGTYQLRRIESALRELGK